MGSEKIKLIENLVFETGTWPSNKEKAITSIHHLLTKRCLHLKASGELRSDQANVSRYQKLGKVIGIFQIVVEKLLKCFIQFGLAALKQTNHQGFSFQQHVLCIYTCLRVWMCLAKVNQGMYFGNKTTCRLRFVRHGIDAFFSHMTRFATSQLLIGLTRFDICRQMASMEKANSNSFQNIHMHIHYIYIG